MTDETFAPGTVLNRRDAAAYIRERWGRPCSHGYLNKLAVTGNGPIFRKIGSRFVVYLKADLDAWVLGQIGRPIRSTTEAAAARADRRFNPF